MIESPPESHDLTATEAPEAPQDPGRREFVVGAAAATTGLALFARAAQAADGAVQAAPAVPASAPAPASPFAAYVEIREDGTVQIVCPQAEIGQGVHDSLARIVADELDADWPTVRVVQPHADAGFASPINRRQRVGGSDSIMAYRDPLRVIGATARAMLVGAAAARWGVAPQDCSTEAGRVRHVASDRSLGFGELAREAAAGPVPPAPAWCMRPCAARPRSAVGCCASMRRASRRALASSQSCRSTTRSPWSRIPGGAPGRRRRRSRSSSTRPACAGFLRPASQRRSVAASRARRRCTGRRMAGARLRQHAAEAHAGGS